MRKFLIPLTVAAAVFGSSAAMAADASGTITAITPATGMVTLSNGATYDFDGSDATLHNFKVGDTVTVNYVQQGSGPLSLKGETISPAS